MAQRLATATIRPLNVQVAKRSVAERIYQERAIMPVIPEERAPGIPPTPPHNLIYHGGKTIPALTFTNFYVGDGPTWKPTDIQQIDHALSAAMADPRLNNVMAQYFSDQLISTRFQPSQVLNGAAPNAIDKDGVEALVTSLYQQGKLAAFDLTSTVFCCMLPSGTILSDDSASGNGNASENGNAKQARKGARKAETTARGGERASGIPDEADEADSLNGLGGYHGSVHVTKDDGTQETVYYAVGVYSETRDDGTENGIVAFDQPWKNVVATFYHELNEARTDPDVEDAIKEQDPRVAKKLLGWVSRQGEECGDFPISEADPLSEVFQQVALADGSGSVPVQFMYSDAVNGPEGPIDQPHPPVATMPRHGRSGHAAQELAEVLPARAAEFPGAGHGADTRGMFVPRGIHIPSGRFGRLFPTLESRPPTGPQEAQIYGNSGGLMDAGAQHNPAHDSTTIPAGFTFFGQFLDHDLDFDPTSMLERQVDPAAIFNFRTPAFDLDTIYGAGPTASPHLYDSSSNGTKLLLDPGGGDLARNSQGTALIGDPRNDENLLLSQLDLAFIRFHNAVVDGLSGQGSQSFADVFDQPLPQPAAPAPNSYFETLFTKAQQVVRWHYQWIITHQFLPLICQATILDDIVANGRRYYRPEDDGREPFMPVEFSVAAYRYGHATIQPTYKINDRYTLSLFPNDPAAPTDPRTDLRGGKVVPDFKVDWANFFLRDTTRPPQFSKRIEPRLNTFLLDLPDTVVPPGIPAYQRSLATRNLLRSETLELPSGQDVARKLGEKVLTDAELGLTAPEPIYLWYYILREAELRTNGEQHGPVGGRIIAEVFYGILDLDPTTYRSAYPTWQPTLPSAQSGDFKITDLLNIAGV